jgi:hypothetical protein
MALLRLAPLGLTLLLALSSLPALADGTAIGQVKTVAGTVTVDRGGARIPVKLGDPVYEADVFETGPDGSLGITFTDNTVMSAGPGSEVGMAEYRFDSSDFKGSMLTDMRKGTLTMQSGDIARSSPGAMRVKTPTAMLGVRGTRFAIEVPEAGK